jgi:hypothetical protein
MVSLAVSPTLTLDVYVPGELDVQGSVVIYRENTDETTTVEPAELDRLIALLTEARALLYGSFEGSFKSTPGD